MKHEEIKRLMKEMEDSKLTEFSIEYPDGIKISMKKEVKEVIVKPETAIVAAAPQSVTVQSDKSLVEVDEYKLIKSPMVGTFYSKASPTSDSFVNVGSKVKKGQNLCIIEAMKLMNEIESEFDGEIVEVCVKDGDMVDFGKTLFKIK